MSSQLEALQVEASLSIKERLLIGQKTFRIMTGNVLGLAADALTPITLAGNDSFAKEIGERVELRSQAGAVTLSRYVLEKEIGHEGFRDRIEQSFVDEITGC